MKTKLDGLGLLTALLACVSMLLTLPAQAAVTKSTEKHKASLL